MVGEGLWIASDVRVVQPLNGGVHGGPAPPDAFRRAANRHADLTHRAGPVRLAALAQVRCSLDRREHVGHRALQEVCFSH